MSEMLGPRPSIQWQLSFYRGPSPLRLFPALLIATVGSPQRPCVVCGDFNIDGLESRRGSAAYRGLAETLAEFQDLGAASDLPTFDPGPYGNALARALEPNSCAQRIDYIFFRPALGAARMRCNKVGLFFDRPLAPASGLDGPPTWASDHYGFSATFECDG